MTTLSRRSYQLLPAFRIPPGELHPSKSNFIIICWICNYLIKEKNWNQFIIRVKVEITKPQTWKWTFTKLLQVEKLPFWEKVDSIIQANCLFLYWNISNKEKQVTYCSKLNLKEVGVKLSFFSSFILSFLNWNSFEENKNH